MTCSTLDECQREAVVNTDGPILIWAGAGSGKTRVIASRVAHLIDTGVYPDELLCFTFTNKAAREMSSRIEDYSGVDTSGMWIGTFHSICARILRIHGTRVLVPPNFTIYDDAQSKALVKSVMQRLGYDPKHHTPEEIKDGISKFKREMTRLDKWLAGMKYRGAEYIKEWLEVTREYQSELSRCASLDFDDIILKTVTLLKESPDILKSLSGRFRYVHVDEYQDSSALDAELADLLSSVNGNLCVVGDVNQSIYGFRGSNHKIILGFPDKHRGTHVYTLDTNYRSCRGIVNTASDLIRNNERRPDYLCKAKSQNIGIATYMHYNGDRDEAAGIARKLEQLVKTYGMMYSDIAVLCRARSLFSSIESALVDRMIPYEKSVGIDFYSKIEIRLAVSFLRLIENIRDNMSAEYVLGKIAHGVGGATVAKVSSSARANGIGLLEACKLARPKRVPGQAWNGLQQICSALATLNVKVEKGASITDLLDYITDTFLTDFCKRNEPSQIRLDNLAALREVTLGYPGPAKETLQGFLEENALATEETKGNEDKVQLMTIHASKGLEFPVVFVPGLEEGILPHARSQTEEDGLEEERRLTYVAITRAINELHLSTAGRRCINGKLVFAQPSRFIEEATCNWEQN